MSDNRTDLPSPGAPNFNQRLRETIQTYLGRQGNPLDRGLTLRDLIETGVLKIREGFQLKPGSGGSVPLEPGDGVVDVYEPDLTPPPTPTTFTATPAISHVLIEHEPPLYTQGHGHLRTRLYGKIVNAGDPLPTFADAVEIGQFSGTVYAHPSNPATTWRFWIKWESVDGVLSANPAGGTNGVAATTGQDVSSLLTALTNQITESQLYSSLGSRINLIDGFGPGSVNARVGSVQSQIDTLAADVAQLSQTPAYDPTVTYAANDLVTYNGGLYKAIQATTGNLPTNTTYWTKIGDYASLSDAVTAHAIQLQDHETRVTATETGLAAETSARQLLATTVANNTSAIQTEATTRATADSALSSSITTLTATANAKNKTYSQAEAPSAGMVTGDIWFDSDDNNKAYRYSGSAWVATDDTRIASNTAAIVAEQTARANADSALASDITTLSSTVSGNYGTLNAAIQTEATTRANADAAEASARQTLQSTVEANNATLTAAIQTEATTRATETGSLFAQYTVKVDLAGHVSGYGLASTANGSAPTSQFGVRANQFFVAPPSVNQATAPTTDLYKGYVWVDTSVTPNVTKYYNGSAWSTTPQALPFIVQASPTTINGVDVPAGVYMDDAYIKNGTITNAKIGNAAIDDAKIANLSASKITAGSIAVGQYIQSAGYVAGSSGWRINGDGNAELSNAVVRGTVYATNGQFWGTLLGGAASSYSSGLGFYAGGGTTSDGANYRWRVGSPTGARIQWNGSAIEVYNSNNQLTLSSGGISASYVSGLGALATQNSVSTGQVTGLGTLATQNAVNWNTQITNIPAFGNFAYLNSITSANISTYIASAAIGTAYIANGAITNALIANAAVGSSQIADAAITNAKIGNAAITTAKIGNAAVDTLQLAGQAVTIPVSAYTAAAIAPASVGADIVVQSLSITSTGAPIFIFSSFSWYQAGTSVSKLNRVYVKRNSTIIFDSGVATSTLDLRGMLSIACQDTPGAGTFTYTVYMEHTSTYTNTSMIAASNRTLLLLEAKR